MNIIEKLGIRKSKIGKSGAFNFTKCLVDINDGGSICHFTDWQDVDIQINVMKSAPEMLEALIDLKIILINHTEWAYKNNNQMYLTALGNIFSKVNLEVIEKATGKTWEEIKELL